MREKSGITVCCGKTYFSRNLFLFGALLLLACLASMPGTGRAATQGDTGQTVAYLIRYVADSGLVFVRNASKYPASEAAEHMERKYQHFRDEIRTPEDFIRLCATRSLMTGKPYKVITAQGNELATAEWLREALQTYRSTPGQDS